MANKSNLDSAIAEGLLSPSLMLATLVPGYADPAKDLNLATLVEKLFRLSQATPEFREFENIIGAGQTIQEGRQLLDAFEQADGNKTAAPAPAEDVRSQIRQHEDRLRAQAIESEHVARNIGYAPIATPNATSQQEIRIQCTTAGQSGGRFSVRNSTDRTTTLQALARPGPGVPEDWWDRVAITFEPSRINLAVGESATFRVGLDLRDAPAIDVPEVEFIIDIVGDEAALLKVWVMLEIIQTDDL